jgi:hypothetical protein
MEEESERRLGFNEATFRKVNESIERGASAPDAAFVCECARLGCTELMRLALQHYAAVREHPRRFLVVPGHELEAVENVVERHDMYLVVEKHGQAGAAAQQSDPRPPVDD